MEIEVTRRMDRKDQSKVMKIIQLMAFFFTIAIFFNFIPQIPFAPRFLPHSNITVCGTNLLDQRSYCYGKWVRSSSGSSELLLETQRMHSCQLLEYSPESVVKCFGLLYQERNSKKNIDVFNKSNEQTELRIIFMGDSRIRQHFYSFLELIPDYDRSLNPIPALGVLFPFHGDLDVYSTLLTLQVSFKWRRFINDKLVHTIRQWTAPDAPERPTLVFLGMEIHHMLQQHGADFRHYQLRLWKLGATLEHLANTSQVIWLNQYPAVEFYGKVNDTNTEIHTQKIHQYNEAVRRVFRNYKNIRIWDSSNLLAEDYVRACGIFEREIPNEKFLKIGSDQIVNLKPFVNCLDFIHIGYVAISEATQLLYNDMCNLKLMLENFIVAKTTGWREDLSYST